MSMKKVEGFSARLATIRARLAPDASGRRFAARIGVGASTYQSWEGRGSAPPEAVLAAALSRLPGVDGLALARWAREGGGDMPSGAGAGSARPAPVG